jgi:3'-phosphoadenosine 5'-phosphosulfate sulfotransferase (PAPS reductase)/FAD synthetase
MIKHVVSVSGGKDSLATLLLALDRFGRERVVAIFCDTGNEHELTYEYLAYLEQRLGIVIHRLKADFTERMAVKRMFIARDVRTGRDPQGRKLRWTNKAKRRALAVLHPTGNPFLDLCLWKGRFPSRKAQFCTQELKRDMAVAFQLELLDQGFTVVSWQGIRRDESENRRVAKKFECIGPRFYTWRPIVDWTAADTFVAAAAHEVKPNPLYLLGMTRVGCMPCINVQKGELQTISFRFPGHINRIEQWEALVSLASKRGFSTFMADAHPAQDRRAIFAALNIRARIEWSMTSRGGKQFGLFTDAPLEACASAYGLCE